MCTSQKIDQTKLSECTNECIHIGFAEEKRAYLLYSHEHCRVFESWDVEFEEAYGSERVTIGSDDGDGNGNGGGEVPEELVDENGKIGKYDDPEGGHRLLDNQKTPMTR